MPSGIALHNEITRTSLNVAAPADLMHDFSRNHYAATYNGTNITSVQLPSGVWVKHYPQDADDDYVSYAGTVGASWMIKAFEIWYWPVAEKAEGAAVQDIIFNKNTANLHGLIRRNVGSPNQIQGNFSDSGGANSTVSYPMPDYNSWFHLFLTVTTIGHTRLIVNGQVYGTGGGFLADNHGNAADVSGAPVRIGGGIATRYDTAMSIGAKIYIGEMEYGEDDFWVDLAYKNFNKNKDLFEY